MELDFELFCRTTISEAPDAIIYPNARGMISFWNRGAERLFGFSEAEALGQRLDIIIPEDLRDRHWQGYEETIADRRNAVWRR